MRTIAEGGATVIPSTIDDVGPLVSIEAVLRANFPLRANLDPDPTGI
ncbi:hypothetical protein SZ00_06138 (plasmid) [Rhodococcus sp. AD45]|nr:hypothetical protein SZ00_06138 [Rhodococcus sp. AD45]